MKRLLPLALLTLSLAAGILRADTLVVLPGSSIQAKIDEAADGDIIAIFGGTYNESLTINKPIRLVELQNQDVAITGKITFQDVADCPPFEGFTVGSTANRQDIEIINTTGLVIRNLDHTAGGGVWVRSNSQVNIADSKLRYLTIQDDNCEVELAKSSAYRIEQRRGKLHVSDVTITYGSNRNDWAIFSHPEAQETVCYRVKTQGGKMMLNSNRVWVGYCQLMSHEPLQLYLQGPGPSQNNQTQAVVVGNSMDSLDNEGAGIHARADSGPITIANCHIFNQRGYRNDFGQDSCIEIGYVSHPVLIYNNTLAYAYSSQGSHAIKIERSPDQGSNIKIRNNFIQMRDPYAIWAPFGTSAQGNIIRELENFRDHFVVGGGIAISDSDDNRFFYAADDPGFQKISNPDGDDIENVYALTENSPLRDTGTQNPLFNDRDGSRNDVGASGGAWYDPEGWTTDKPVVISFDLAPELVLEGVDTEVTIDEVKAVSAP